MKADFSVALNERLHCTNDPDTCNYTAIAIPGSPMDLHTREVVAQRVRDNLRGKAGFGGIEVKFESVGFEGDSAFVSICAYDTAVLFDIQDPLNAGDDIIVDDHKGSYRTRWEMQLLDGRWLMFEGIQSQRLDDGNLCDV